MQPRKEDCLLLLLALKEAYQDASFQEEILQMKEQAKDELGYLTKLGPRAAAIQAPIFQRFGLPQGQKGVILMKLGVRLCSQNCAELKDLAGDLREMLLLPREEEDISSAIKKAESGLRDLEQQIARAPLDVRGPLAEALQLPYKAKPDEIARAVPQLQKRAQELAEQHLARGRGEIIGEGKLLPAELASASDEVLRTKVREMFERYLQKMLSRVITPLESFTRSPAEFRCSWAQRTVSQECVEELWGDRRCDSLGSLGDGLGVAVLDETMDGELLREARRELTALEDKGEVTASQDPCNVGARSVWLHFEEAAQVVPPALQEVCERLLGLPDALLQASSLCGVSAPRLRVHPHIMAATYRKGAEYHCHKDSYSGTDNQRMVTVLLYLNEDWVPGDGGELRLFEAKPHVSDGSLGLQREAASAPGEGFVDVAPLAGRIVMFRSRDVWHAVREPREQRWAMTLWVMAD